MPVFGRMITGSTTVTDALSCAETFLPSVSVPVAVPTFTSSPAAFGSFAVLCKVTLSPGSRVRPVAIVPSLSSVTVTLV
ncbi:MAG: hypothetical protein ACXVD7_08270, partial [Actinomycetota bacterium]